MKKILLLAAVLLGLGGSQVLAERTGDFDPSTYDDLPTYRIWNKYREKFMSAGDGATGVSGVDAGNETAQEFKFVPVTGQDGYVYIYSVGADKYFGIADNAAAIPLVDANTNPDDVKKYTFESEFTRQTWFKCEGTNQYVNMNRTLTVNTWDDRNDAAAPWLIALADEYEGISNWQSNVNKFSSDIPEASNLLSKLKSGALLLNSEQISTNAQSYDEGPLADILDGNTTTHFHSTYSASNNISEPHYLIFRFNNSDGIKDFTFGYTARNANNRPTKINVYGSTDGGSSFAETAVVLTDGLGQSEGNVNFSMSEVYNALKFEVIEAKNSNGTADGGQFNDQYFFTYAEVQLYVQGKQSLASSAAQTEALEAAINAMPWFTASATELTAACSTVLNAMGLGGAFDYTTYDAYPTKVIYSPSRSKYISVNNFANLTGSDTGTANAQKFKLIPAQDGVDNHYYLWNVGTRKYAGACKESTKVSMVSPNDFVSPQIYVYQENPFTDKATIQHLSGTYRQHFHLDGYNNVVGWSNDSNDTWWLCASENSDFSKWNENLETAEALANEVGNKALRTYERMQSGALIFDVNQISTNAQCSKEGPLANIIDGDVFTHFHTMYDEGEVTEPHYLAFSFENTTESKGFTFEYTARNSNANNRPTQINVYGSTDGGETFQSEPIQLSEGLGNASGAVSFTMPEVYNALKFEVTNTNTPNSTYNGQPFFTYAEVQLYANPFEPDSYEQAKLNALNEALNNAKNIDLYSASTDDINAAKEALLAAFADAQDYEGGLAEAIAAAEAAYETLFAEANKPTPGKYDAEEEIATNFKDGIDEAKAATANFRTARNTLAKIVKENTPAASNTEIPTGHIYTIQNIDIYNDRGYLIHSDREGIENRVDTSKKSPNTSLDSDDAKWLFVKDDNGNAYLYNLGAKQFANTYGQANFATDSKFEYSWQFSNIPTALTLGVPGRQSNETDERKNSGYPAVTIMGGDNSKTQPGFMIANGTSDQDGRSTPVPVACGIYSGDANHTTHVDGNGFWFHYVGEATEEQMTAATKMLEEALATATEVTEMAEKTTLIVNHYNEQVFDAIKALGEDAPVDKIHHVLEANVNNIYPLQAGTVYTLENEAGVHAVVNDTENFGGKHSFMQAGHADIKATKWLCVGDEDNGYSFYHIYKANPRPATEGEVALLALDLDDADAVVLGGRNEDNSAKTYTAQRAGLGLTHLGDAPELQNLVITNVGSSEDDAITTGITDVTADGRGGEAEWYTLQGVRVARPTAGGVYLMRTASGTVKVLVK